MTLSQQKQAFETWLRSRGIEPTYMINGEYSGAFVIDMWDKWKELERMAGAQNQS